MVSPNERKGSENLAERLRSLYQVYGCESELPIPNDLVAKLDGVEPGVRDAVQMELDRDYMRQLSYEEALKFEKSVPLTGKFIELYAFTLAGGCIYAAEKCEEKNLKQEGFPFLLYAVQGGIKTFPSVVKEIFLTPKEEIAKEIMEEHNKDATRYFELFKRNVEYYILSESFKRNPSHSKNKVQN